MFLLATLIHKIINQTLKFDLKYCFYILLCFLHIRYPINNLFIFFLGTPDLKSSLVLLLPPPQNLPKFSYVMASSGHYTCIYVVNSFVELHIVSKSDNKQHFWQTRFFGVAFPLKIPKNSCSRNYYETIRKSYCGHQQS